MIYKFKSKEEFNGEHGYLELSKENDKLLLSVNVNGKETLLTLNKETLYNVIGAMHSIQTNIKKEGQNG